MSDKISAIQELEGKIEILKNWRDNPDENGVGYDKCIDFYERLLAEINELRIGSSVG